MKRTVQARRLWWIAAFALLVLALAACGGSSGEAETPAAEPEPTTQTEPAAETDAAVETAAAETAEAEAAPELSGEMTLATWGGEYTKATVTALLDPFSEATGVTTKTEDAPGEFNAKLEAMAKAGNVTWDVIDLGEEDAIAAANEGLLQPLPEDVKQRLIDAVGEDQVTDYGISIAAYASVIVCNPEAVEKCPTTPAEFWDVEGFPGRRTMYGDGWSEGIMYALLADGVPADQLFPLDFDRAFAKLDEIKPDIAVWWTTGDQSQQIFRDEEVAIGILWDGRAYGLPKQGVNVEVSHDGSPITRDLFVVPADAPNPDAAFAFLEWYATNPEAEAKWAELMNYGVASPRAFDFIPEEVASTLATYPANLEVSVPVDVAWVAEHREAGLKRWTDWLGK